MRERAYYKERGKAAFKRNYWICVLVAFILLLVTPSGGRSNGRNDSNSNAGTEHSIDFNMDLNGFGDNSLNIDSDTFNGTITGLSPELRDFVINNIVPLPMAAKIVGAATITLVFFLVIAVAIAVTAFILNVIQVGGNMFFIENAKAKAQPGLLLSGFGTGYYLNCVKVMLIMNIKKFLWTLLFIIPGIIKSFEYFMIPYLIADFPDMDRKECFRISKEMMYGHKFDTMLLQLSFILWKILGAITFGLVDLFWVNPYMHATNAELYLDFKRQYFGVSEEEPAHSYEETNHTSEAEVSYEDYMKKNSFESFVASELEVEQAAQAADVAEYVNPADVDVVREDNTSLGDGWIES